MSKIIRTQYARPEYSLLMLVLTGLLSACSVKDGPPDEYGLHWQKIPNAIPKHEAPSKYGNPASYEVLGERYYVLKSSNGFSQQGVASWYGSKFHGQRTSSGEKYNMYAMTAAHKSLPLPTYVEVTNLANDRKAIVKVNDRGPFHEGRIIDLSYAAATRLGISETGTAPVKIRVVTSNTVAGPAQSGGSAINRDYAAGGIDASFTDDNGRLYVQIAAFTTENNALKMLEELRDKDFSGARIHVENKQGKLLYRVRIGPVPTADVAQKLVTQLKELNYDNTKTITYN